MAQHLVSREVVPWWSKASKSGQWKKLKEYVPILLSLQTATETVRCLSRQDFDRTLNAFPTYDKKIFFVLKTMRQCSLDRSVTDQHRRVHCTDSELFSGRIFCRCRYAPRMARDVAKPMRAGNKTVTIRVRTACDDRYRGVLNALTQFN
ncbi:hypothetical protein EVAR_66384_1 [Eumeta japonica]|uniref:Uncharacterized protein n=1 Tax=Eumeta variegata TaxID=151549 RepID=A0A4C1ZMZ7_EUMVA|nr:hypothetical protein EVAR_66384_1 [Eumeta japonica]